jgi:hypothetical protein
MFIIRSSAPWPKVYGKAPLAHINQKDGKHNQLCPDAQPRQTAAGR